MWPPITREVPPAASKRASPPNMIEISVRWPYNDVDGPGFAVAPDGTVEECWQTQVGQIAETHVRCRAAR